ncbi:MAG: sugar phosphate isomerase/epimerase [Candidatus Latescibacteria bacterium]|nr:sugar phosphate isomerase/epimerase [Candidatus Latescibacterota bacterium]
MLIGNPMMLRQLPIEDALERMKTLGYEGIEVCLPDIQACKTSVLKRQFNESVRSFGLTLIRYNTAAADYFTPLAHPDDWPRVLEGLKQDIDTAAALGVPHLLAWEGRPPPGASREEIHGWALDATTRLFQDAIPYARQHGVHLSVEVHPFTMGIDTAFLVTLCDRLDPEWFSVTYDCCHFGVGLPEGYIEAVHALGRRIQHIHFSDSDRHSSELHFAPGAGCLDLPGIVRALKAIGFHGTCMLDLWLYPFPIEGSRIGVPYLRRVMDELGIH